MHEVRLYFYTPRWQQQLTPTKAITDLGTPVHIVNAVPVVDADAAPILVTKVKEWLVEHGFEPDEEKDGNTLHRGQVRSIFGPAPEIEVLIGDEGKEVSKLRCQFTLQRRTPPALSDWAKFTAELCQRFHLRLGDEGIAPCGEAEFLAAVRDNRNYQEFAAGFGWETV